jgi:hypothetical protein
MVLAIGMVDFESTQSEWQPGGHMGWYEDAVAEGTIKPATEQPSSPGRTLRDVLEGVGPRGMGLLALGVTVAMLLIVALVVILTSRSETPSAAPSAPTAEPTVAAPPMRCNEWQAMSDGNDKIAAILPMLTERRSGSAPGPTVYLDFGAAIEDSCDAIRASGGNAQVHVLAGIVFDRDPARFSR